MVKDEEAGLGDDIYDGGYQEPSDSDEKLKQWEMEAEQVNQLEALREKELDRLGNADPKLSQIEKSTFQEFPSDSDSSALVEQTTSRGSPQGTRTRGRQQARSQDAPGDMQDDKKLEKTVVYQSPTRPRHAMLPASARGGSRHKFSTTKSTVYGGQI